MNIQRVNPAVIVLAMVQSITILPDGAKRLCIDVESLYGPEVSAMFTKPGEVVVLAAIELEALLDHCSDAEHVLSINGECS